MSLPPWSYDSADLHPKAVQELIEIYQSRKLLWLMVVNQFTVRYRRSIMGMLWIFLQPLLYTFTLTIALGTVFRNNIINYPVYVVVGMLVWQYFNQATITGIDTAVASRELSSRIYLPRSIHVLAAIGSSLVNYLLGFIPIGFLLMVFHYQPVMPWLLLPVAILLMTIFIVGVTLLIGTAAIYMGDVAPIYGALLQITFFITPVVFPRQAISAKYSFLLYLNPVGHYVSFFRDILYTGSWPSLSSWVIVCSLSLVSFLIGWIVFTRKAGDFVYHP